MVITDDIINDGSGNEDSENKDKDEEEDAKMVIAGIIKKMKTDDVNEMMKKKMLKWYWTDFNVKFFLPMIWMMTSIQGC